jgi:drug/metabolite transporter (DMT)-like permease
LFCTGTVLSKKEWVGVLLVVIGCIFMIFDPKALRTGVQNTDLVAATVDICSAMFGAFYYLLSARNVKNVPIFFLIFMMSLHTFLINSSIAKLQDPQISILSFDTQYGCLGFLNFTD